MGTEKNVRDWLHVTDHCEGIWKVLTDGMVGETYNIGGNCEMQNIDVVKRICQVLETRFSEGKLPNASRPDNGFESLIDFVGDRQGHDRRYAIDSGKIERELGWKPKRSFDSGLEETVEWYLNNRKWIDTIRSGEYKKWIDINYSNR